MLAKQRPANLPVTPNRNKTEHGATSAIAARTHLQRRDRDLPLHKVQPKVKRPKHLKCHKFGCLVNNSTQNENGTFKYKHIKYHNVPKNPAKLKGKTPCKQSVVHRQVKIFHRREMLRQMGLDPSAHAKSFRICECHTFGHETHWVSVKHGNQSWSQRCKLMLPANIGPKSTVIESNDSSGLGTDRELKRILDESRKIMEKGFVVECAENEDESPKKKVWLSHARTTTAQLCVVEKERESITKPRL